MVVLLHVVAIVLVALAAALSVAHALEMPGKMRLDRETYVSVQRIYYPGFTFGGFSEPLGTAATAVLLYYAPPGTTFWLALTALLCMFATMTVFWTVTQPANKFWTKGLHMSAAGSSFFKTGPGGTDSPDDWASMRDRWEWSHVSRAFLTVAAFLSLLAALALDS